MRDVRKGASGTLVQRRSWMMAGMTLALLTSGCLQDGMGTGPSTGAARLAINASVAGTSLSAAAVTALAVQVSYLRGEGSPAPLLVQVIPLTDVSPGGTVRQPVSVDLGPCLGDPLHQPGGNACSVVVRVSLLADGATLDVVEIGPLTLRPGETSDPAEVTLHTANTLVVTPASFEAIFPGETLQLTARLLGAAGNVVEGRTITWSSNAPSVATVDANGKVTAVVPGNALISAAGGDLTTSVLVRVVARSTILIDRQSLTFEVKQTGALPEGQNVHIVNGSPGALDGLALGSISYSGDASGWLGATLSGSSAPATLVLRPFRTNLAPGSYTADVTITAPTAGNSGIAVQVTYNVTAATALAVGKTLFQTSGIFQQEPAQFRTTVTSAGPLTGLRADIEYGPHASDWLTARFSSDSTPSELLLEVSGFRFPGNYQADVRITAPGAANDVLVQVLWTVPVEDWHFNVSPSPGCVYIGEQQDGDSVYVNLGASLSWDGGGVLAGQAFFIRPLGPGLTVLVDSGTTYGNPAVVTRAPGYFVDVRVAATVGWTRQPAPGSLSDTVTIRFTDDYYGCYEEGYEEGSPSRAPYAPGAPAMRRSPVARSSMPSAAQAATPRARKAASATAPPSATNRSRPTPEHN